MTIKQKIGGAIATGTFLLSVMAPAAFAADVTIHHNGAGSNNGAAIIKLSKSKVKQKNTTNVATNVTVTQKTGKNSTNNNVGGSNTITTGEAKTTTKVDVAGGTNTNNAVNCCCDGEGSVSSIDIHHNGADSNNGVLVIDACKNVVKQSNTTNVETNVSVYQNTGGNSASGNVGGTNDITTGDATTSTTVTVTGSSNSN